MPRELSTKTINKMTLSDDVSGDSYTFMYTLPTTSQRARYQSQLFKVRGNKVKSQVLETRMRLGLELLKGFEESKKNPITGQYEGGFVLDGEPISSDQESPNYREDWKDILEKGAADVIAFFALRVFEGVKTDESATFVDEETEDDESGEETGSTDPQ